MNFSFILLQWLWLQNTALSQSLSIEFYKIQNHLEALLEMLEINKMNTKENFNLLYTNAKSIANKSSFTITYLRIYWKTIGQKQL